MKIRNGFVSNSSSSSFIIAIAKVEDLNKWSNRDYVEIIKVSDIKNTWSINKNSERINIDSFSGASVDIRMKNLTEDDYIAFIRISNDEGDEAFMNEDHDYDYSDINYDIDLDFFDEDQQLLYNEFSDGNGLSNVEKTYGADRNG